MIQRPRPNPEKRRITAYDFEWDQDKIDDRDSKLTITLAGAYDERGYRWYTRLSYFLNGELTHDNSGRRYYAHFGGASDMVFLLRELIKDRTLQIRGIFSGSSAIVVTVWRGSDHWTFVDSFWLMRVKLADIGAWLGLPKLDMPARDAPMAVQKEYNERDCVILHRAIRQFEEAILDRGGQLCITAASTSLDMFLRRYLKRPIANGPAIDAWARPAYVGSRVEKFEDKCSSAQLYDINSSFPYSMTFPVPGSFIGMSRGLPEKGLWIADVDVRVPPQDFPPLPYRGEDQRVYYPTGAMRTRITSEDMLCGDFQVLKVHDCWCFEERLDMAEFAEDFYKLRQEGGFQSEVWKIVLNSLYGKFAEREEKQILLVNPDKRPDPEKSEALEAHIFLVDEDITIEHSHVPISCMITARSRRFLREWLVKAGRMGKVYYCDTDSVICDASLEDCPGVLGRLKHEATIVKGQFHGSKLYAYELDSGKVKVKAKGFSRKVSEGGERESLNYEDFTRLCDGESIKIERMLRIKELLRREKSDYTPIVRRADKQLRAPRPKRRSDGNGGSIAWDVGEIAG